MDGASQTPRERILSVPFAQVAGNLTQNLQDQIDSLNNSIGQILMQNQIAIKSLRYDGRLTIDQTTSRVFSDNLYLFNPTNKWSRSEHL